VWDDIEQIAWRRLKHNYGPASDVPGWLRDCASDDTERAAAALDDFDSAVYHQGGWICPAAPAALPYLVDLAAGRAVHHRPVIVRLIATFIDEAAIVDRGNVDAAWPAAVERELPRLTVLLDDPEPAVRRETTWLLSRNGLPQRAVTSAIWRRWHVEDDRVTRWDLIAAFGALLERDRDAGDIRALLHELLDDADVQTGLAAVHALAGTDPDVPLTRAPHLLAAIRDPGIGAWRNSAWFGASVIDRTSRLLQHDPVVAADFALTIGAGSDRDERIAGLQRAAALLAQWRTLPPALHDFLVERLADDDAEVRFRAAFLLACVPSPTAADALATLAADTAVRDSRGDVTVGDAAVWALARLGDARCVPLIRQRLAGPRLGFAPNGQFYTTPAGSWDGFWLPAVDEALTPLATHAASLAPAVRVGSSHALCRLLGAWGAASAPAVPQLVTLLGRRDLQVTAAEALGGIGPAAADATADLRRHASIPAAAWAHWRVTADPVLALDALAGVTHHHDLRRLGDLGPLAADEADRLHRLTRSKDDWVRVEAAYAHYRVTADSGLAVAVLTDLAAPLVDGTCAPVMITALKRLAAIGPAAEPAHPIGHAVLNSPHRLSYFGGWHVFEEDEQLRAAATTLLSRAGRL
jgi:HEAT repeat protein